jgi:two-component SAPR family response regulator
VEQHRIQTIGGELSSRLEELETMLEAYKKLHADELREITLRLASLRRELNTVGMPLLETFDDGSAASQTYSSGMGEILRRHLGLSVRCRIH